MQNCTEHLYHVYTFTTQVHIVTEVVNITVTSCRICITAIPYA